MYLLAPDILKDARELSPALLGLGLLVGALLWLLGAWSHRFWLVLVTTTAAGLHGLLHGPSYGLQPLVAGLLLAVATGALALSLVRVLVFAAGGVAALAVGRALSLAVDEPLLCVLIGGLVGIVFYRLWITAMASLIGTLLLAYSGASLADRFGRVDMAAWATKNALLINWGLAAFALLGVLVQYYLERRRVREKEEEAEEEEQRSRRLLPRPWWKMGWGNYRQAG